MYNDLTTLHTLAINLSDIIGNQSDVFSPQLIPNENKTSHFHNIFKRV